MDKKAKTDTDYSLTKKSCYYTYLAMSSAFSLPPIMFVTFHEMYGIPYTLLGTLVLVNFITQLSIDLVFSFFSKYFNIKLTVRIMPIISSVGMFIYAAVPLLFPDHAYAGLITGTVIFSVAAGLSEVLLSPTIAALPSDDPGRDMSRLHSLYGWGVVTVVLVSTAVLTVIGRENWMYLTFFWALLPLVSSVLFSISPFPEIDLRQELSPDKTKKKNLALALCVLCIFFGSAAENVMTNWISAYLEKAVGLSKTWCDLVGIALFAILLGTVRTIYAKKGKDIFPVLFFGMIAAAICYIVAGLSPFPVLSLAACVLTGIFTSMLWPGTLILIEELTPGPGVAAYALLAAGGDFGASVAPQLLGITVDNVAAGEWASRTGEALSMTAEQIGMKTGILTAAIYPILGAAVVFIIGRFFSRSIALKKHIGK
jgi:MFS family permease